MNPLFYPLLREANLARLPTHAPACLEWSNAQWFQAVIGELGEYANFRKKFDRGDLTQEEFTPNAANELADIFTYLDILASQHKVSFLTMRMVDNSQTPAQLVQTAVQFLGSYVTRCDKYDRKMYDDAEFRSNVSYDLTMVVNCLESIADDLEIHLEDVTIDKFNAVSERIDSPIRIANGLVIDLRDRP